MPEGSATHGAAQYASERARVNRAKLPDDTENSRIEVSEVDIQSEILDGRNQKKIY